jgi:hypothetical protein
MSRFAVNFDNYHQRGYREHDYLKYYRIIKFFFQKKYKLSSAELDMLLFIYSEKYFGNDDINMFKQCLPWDKARFGKLVREGWIDKFRTYSNGAKALFEISFKGARMVNSLYKKLEGEDIPTTVKNNPLLKVNIRFSDKVHRAAIKEMNLKRQLKRHALKL